MRILQAENKELENEKLMSAIEKISAGCSIIISNGNWEIYGKGSREDFYNELLTILGPEFLNQFKICYIRTENPPVAVHD